MTGVRVASRTVGSLAGIRRPSGRMAAGAGQIKRGTRCSRTAIPIKSTRCSGPLTARTLAGRSLWAVTPLRPTTRSSAAAAVCRMSAVCRSRLSRRSR